MHIKNFCFILPAEVDEPQKFYSAKQSLPRQGCGAPTLDLFKRQIYRFFRSGWFPWCRRHRPPPHKAYFDAQGVPMDEEQQGAPNPRIFSYAELYIGSSGFHEREILGSGGFGRVYRAVLPSDGTAVAVKCLGEDSRGGLEKTFLAELAAVAHLRHRNLVPLRGWCIHDGSLLLVYDYMPNRSLDRVLFGKKANSLLSWEKRKRIVTGLAAALHYLHHQLDTQIIHRDVKSSNVMLDSDFNARLGDFGLARWLEHGLPYEANTSNRMFRVAESSRIGGTIGYLPPESFQKRSKVTTKSDVFGFGIVVLEVVSGRRAVDLTRPDDRIVLLDWIRRLSDEGRLLEAGDAQIRDWSDVERFLCLGLLCTLHDPQSRPNIKWVVEFLSGNIDFDKQLHLPSFLTQPLYISISSSPITTTTNTSNTNSSQTASIRTSLRHSSSNMVSANSETIYFTAESSEMSSAAVPAGNENTFPVIEIPRPITYDEIASATHDFSDAHRLAEIDFGTAYRGILDGHRHIIVKRLGMKTCPALRMRFADEFRNMGRLRHRNLAQLRGWCTERGEMLVVYDYSPSRVLRNMLPHLTWRQRYDIIKSLASAIRYLHEEWDEQVIHRNITSSAVMLDRDANPRLGSFALAEFLTRNEHGGPHQIITANDKNKSVRGIFGYMSPEYMESGEATAAGDVYSFGVVVLEVVTGRAAVDFREREVMLVGRMRRNEELVDWRLGEEYDGREMERLVRLGLACTRSEPELRPSMRQIVSILEGYDQLLSETSGRRQEGIQEWKQRNASSLSLVRRIQALTIH
ncbi:Receptor like protein kinase S.2 [Striga hermonthica]|uniref:Receptor like protein kinase S.2 n=1 Tax=Striga hermonthica TaxID=68872 RepID=A0A9N7NAA5_STRHE|nr:Receptor like protein kinase S.2 [Striga hermonthica]